MKILIINANDLKGGAARAAYRLNKSLQKIGVNSQMLVQDKTGVDCTVLGPETRYKKIVANIRPRLNQAPVKLYKKRLQIPFSPAWVPFSDIVSRIKKIDPDIVHLHWITGGMVRIEDIAKINKPIIWSLHDMWAFTGGCHYDNNCGKYESECAFCPVLNSGKKKDLSNRIFNQKKRIYKKIKNLTIVGLSRWLTNCVDRSVLLSSRKVINIPNPINTEIFCPVEVKTAREILGLPLDKKLILFGADSITDYLKGFKELSKALDKIKKTDVEIIVFGSGELNTPKQFKFPTHYIGQLSDDISLKILYNASDVTILPSLQENLSNVVMESLSCGTPTVAFNIGGNSDMIEHQVNGYLADPFSTDDLTKGIDWVLYNPEYETLKQNARKKVLQQFEMVKVAQQYKELYESILAE
ncbi:MAG: glycosyltransferase family 4 protein [Candidatus Omnitrophica bacterium]|nr:glycosyltransferase family 4 protein [Candidatus Omnitrophota bacterium]MCG2708263.1 glycosyltransferase family 4 protein [Candidatus Omnitrophota bacterium]